MSARPCSTCKKTVYVNEKIDADGRWYHKICFKMAVLDESVMDEETGRPLKVLVCKQHVPQIKRSLGTDSLEMKSKTSAPKPSMLGLHRALMGDAGRTEGDASRSPRSGSSHSKGPSFETTPRNTGPLSAGSVGDSLSRQFNTLSLEENGGDSEAKNHHTQSVTRNDSKDNDAETKTEGTTVAKEEPVPKSSSHEEQEEEDDSFRTLPVSHDDYEVQPPAAKPHHPPKHDEDEDEKREREFSAKSTTVDDTPEGGRDEVDEVEVGDKGDESPKRVSLTMDKKFAIPEPPRQGRVESDNEDAQDDDDEWDAPEDKSYEPSGIAVK
ncbi:hypothetical protein BGZ73_001506 [Actinomortierella ambigua]|nr:hypothetical protein BGZ73_001506 [Actinomortierella ambigua]